ncbi:3-deoxy-D-manno-octulosonic acid transferase [Zhouia sp. PK063]|uniref:3-deoxy-D-manno-octulosonic acid transferase n=1 Tax=Zhouia sp. PK063 TaxID=3373602 RepID=UPI0037AB3DAA
MLFLYNILVHIAGFFLKIVALFQPKIKLFVNGRKAVFKTLAQNISTNDKVIWFHTASLGEFEQGLPVIEEVKKEYPSHKILVTFFSPSGYEVKKNSTQADVITYLPLDTKSNVQKFLNVVHPDLAIFVKYEFWPNYLNALKKRKISTLLISAIFRKEQIFFKPQGSFMRSSLKTFEHFFVQDESSKQLLNNIGFNNVTVSGDTRFDRVAEIVERNNTLSFIEDFKNDKLCFVAGSTWPEDEALLIDYINKHAQDNVKYIIAPHNIKPHKIQELKNNLKVKTMLFSEKESKPLSTYKVFIVDTIGILTKIYSYANIAYVGGGMGTTGLHNTLEPAVFGIPVLIGKNYKGFKEAEDLVTQKGIVSISNLEEFDQNLTKFITNPVVRAQVGLLNHQYLKNNTGAKIQITYHIRKLV